MVDFRQTLSMPTIALGRRAFLQVGALALGHLTIADQLHRRAVARDDRSEPTAVIQIYMGGGPSHLDMFDLKPDAPREIRGEFQPIPTNVAGYQVCEHLPHLAQVMDKLAVVRTVHHENPGHLPASHWMMTGHNAPAGTLVNTNPSVGSVVSRLRGSSHPGMPAYVSVPRRQLVGASAFLGTAHNPFTPDSDPSKKDFGVFNLKMPPGMNVPRLEDRQGLLQALNRYRDAVDAKTDSDGMDKFSRQALQMVTSGRALKAFNLEDEDPQTRERYGAYSVGQGCLLARRLVEAGVTLVTVLSGGDWDTHVNNFPILKNDCLPRIDRALAALVSDLRERSLDRRVMVVAYGEFGRTPQINSNGGRDHWPGANSVVFAGGGLNVGQMIGATDRQAAFPITKGYSPGDVLSTVYQFLGIDWHYEFHDQNLKRPMLVLPEGRPIAELIG